MIVTLQEVQAFASQQLDRAKNFATKIQFVEKSAIAERYSAESRSIRASIADDPEFAGMEYSDGKSTWTSILSVDLRDSTKLADQISPRNMYLTTVVVDPMGTPPKKGKAAILEFYTLAVKNGAKLELVGP